MVADTFESAATCFLDLRGMVAGSRLIDADQLARMAGTLDVDLAGAAEGLESRIRFCINALRDRFAPFFPVARMYTPD